MSTELIELGNWIKQQVLAKGASDCSVTLDKRRLVEMNYREKKPETIKEATTRNLSLEIYMDGKYSVAITPDLRKNSLETFIAKSVENTQYIEKDPHRTLPDKKYIEGQLKKDLDLYDSDIPGLSTESKHQLVKDIEAACIEKGGDKAISVVAGVNFSERERIILSSNGFENSFKITGCSASASMTVQDEGERRPNGGYWASTRYFKDLPASQEIGEKAALRTFDLMGAKKLPTEQLPVVIENRAVGRILSWFLSGLMGRNIQQERSILADKKGKKVASDKLTIVDNPLLVKGLSSRLFDEDGFPTQKRSVITNGVIDTFYYDWYYSRKMGVEPTTGSFSNLEFGLGDKSQEQLMKSVGRGMLITGFIGGNSNSTTGDFSIGVLGHLFENGVPVQAISEMNIADNHLEFWNKLVETGNDPNKYSSWKTPSLLFDDIVVAGK